MRDVSREPRGTGLRKQETTAARGRTRSSAPDSKPETAHAGGRLLKILVPYRQVRRRGAWAGGPSVSRRGTCDRGICTKPLARRTRWSYGFRMRDSRFVRRRVGLSGVVKGVGESVGRSEDAIG